MTKPRVMMIGLDGFELSIAERLMAEGRLPAMARLRERGAAMLLDHGAARRTGLAWEHVSSGLSPDDARRWSAAEFDPAAYSATQRPAAFIPFPAALESRTTVFDAPYFDLARAPSVEGLVNWGAHDPGVERNARPPGLAGEIEARFGPYPATQWIYGFVWPSPERTSAMAGDLARAVRVRSDIAQWMFAERLPDWELGLLVIAEYHSAVEALWHGVDPSHPLHHLPSAEPARHGLEAVYEEGDRLIGRMVDLFPDAAFAVFNLHGMGPNHADLPCMALLPELLYRCSFGRPCMGAPVWPVTADGVPLITGDGTWEDEIDRILPRPVRRPGRLGRGLAALRALIRPSVDRGLPLAWMPSDRYAPFWPRMRAFAMPSFYDGQVRINLKGREARGLVDPADYEDELDAIEALVRGCRDPLSGEPVVAEVVRTGRPGHQVAPSEADMNLIWREGVLGLAHPVHGTIGPLPCRRAGGHTGRTGVAWFAGPGIRPGDYPPRSAFDVVPTIVDMLGEPPAARMSGTSALREIALEAETVDA
jgi:predicted AlkP superfamily phosphohydrolase/phosphomutase